MTGNYHHLVAHIREHEAKLYCAALPAESWEAVRLSLELAGADFAALPIQSEGWLVLSSYPLSSRALDMSACWDELLDGYVIAEGADMIVLSECWAAAATDSRSLALR